MEHSSFDKSKTLQGAKAFHPYIKTIAESSDTSRAQSQKTIPKKFTISNAKKSEWHILNPRDQYSIGSLDYVIVTKDVVIDLPEDEQEESSSEQEESKFQQEATNAEGYRLNHFSESYDNIGYDGDSLEEVCSMLKEAQIPEKQSRHQNNTDLLRERLKISENSEYSQFVQQIRDDIAVNDTLDPESKTLKDVLPKEFNSNLKTKLIADVIEKNPKVNILIKEVKKISPDTNTRDLTAEQKFYANKVNFKKNEFEHFVNLGKKASYDEFTKGL